MVSVVFETHLLKIERNIERDKHGTYGTMLISVTLNTLHDRGKKTYLVLLP